MGTVYQKKREINCLYCQEVHTLNSQFDNEAVCCVTESKEFGMLFTSEIVLKNILTRLHESKGDYLDSITCNRSLGYAAYKQFIWCLFNYLRKGNRRVIPCCALWKIRNCFPEPNADYVNYSEGKKTDLLRYLSFMSFGYI